MNVIALSARKPGPAPKRRARRALWGPLAVFAVTFPAALYALTPDAPGRDAIADFVRKRTTDQHFVTCIDARAAGRENIPAWDPSYRSRMDGDGDGLACEPYRTHW